MVHKMVTDIPIPVLETERLVLRGHRLEDFEKMVPIWSDPIVRRHFHGESLTREDLWGRFLRGFGMWAVMGYGLWAVEEKSTGDYIGAVGVFEVKRDMAPSLEGTPEAGWTLAAAAHGKGYATEAARAMLAWVDKCLAVPTFCLVAPANQPSIRVAEKCGYAYWRDTTYKDEPTHIFLRDPAPSESG